MQTKMRLEPNRCMRGELMCNTRRVKRWHQWHVALSTSRVLSTRVSAATNSHHHRPLGRASVSRVKTLVLLHESARPSSTEPYPLVVLHESETFLSQSFVKDKTRYYTFNSPHSRPNLCWLGKVKRRRDTSRYGQRSERREQCEHRGRCAQSCQM